MDVSYSPSEVLAIGFYLLKFYSFATGATETVAEIRLNPNIGNGLSISPDGRYALMTLFDPDVCDLMVVDNFR